MGAQNWLPWGMGSLTSIKKWFLLVWGYEAAIAAYQTWAPSDCDFPARHFTVNGCAFLCI